MSMIMPLALWERAGMRNRASLDSAGGTQVRQLIRVQPKVLAEDLVGVLADRGGIRPNAGRGLRQMDPGRDEGDRACRLVVPLNKRAALFNVRVRHHFVDGEDRPTEVAEV